MVEIGQPVLEIFQKHQLVARLEDARDLEVQDRRSTLCCKGPTEGEAGRSTLLNFFINVEKLSMILVGCRVM